MIVSKLFKGLGLLFGLLDNVRYHRYYLCQLKLTRMLIYSSKMRKTCKLGSSVV